ncbi:hypothetical protein [Mycobacterium shigaense]|uniref:hypothetical protein n=1 Tax=Mycobacterium shigaense TaxID=722731 RepID=UPI002AE06852|nr:hypothetical protein [Mycobacterium shigaense]MEA1121369.1 hypothetical protein [Mycobacterium shigaense]
MAATRGAVLWILAAVGYLVLESAVAASAGPAYGYAARHWYRRICILVATFGVLCLIMLTINARTARAELLPDGAWERGSVYSIILWQLVIAIDIVSTRRP